MITVTGLHKYFHRGTPNEVHSLQGLSFTLKKGDFVTIIGSNGAGKSTLLSCLAGTHKIDAGQIAIDTTTITHWPEHQRAQFIGRVFQDPLMGTFAGGTIAQNLALAFKRGQPRRLRPGVRTEDKKVFKERLATLNLGLENRLYDLVGLLSGGQRQALTMVMATLVRPELLLLDEHTAALDPKTALQILKLTERLVHEHNLTTLMVTHNMQQALQLGNRIIMMHQGKILLDAQGADKRALTVPMLLEKFHIPGEDTALSDRMLLG